MDAFICKGMTLPIMVNVEDVAKWPIIPSNSGIIIPEPTPAFVIWVHDSGVLVVDTDGTYLLSREV